MTDKPHFDPTEQVMIDIAPAALAVQELMRATEDKQIHPAGVYQEVEASVISLKAEKSAQLVAIKIPIGVMLTLAQSYSNMRNTEYGQKLTEKYLKWMEERDKGETDED